MPPAGQPAMKLKPPACQCRHSPLVVAAGCGLPAAIPFTSENVFDVRADIPEVTCEVTRLNRQLGKNLRIVLKLSMRES